MSLYEVLIIGGGPSGLQAALTLGRAGRRVLLCDSGPRRNAAAEQIHNFVTRDGTAPDEFRRVARDQLTRYPNVEVRDAFVDSVAGQKGAFHVALGAHTVGARRLLLCTGMVDQMLPISGFAELWGHAIVQCPYCHGWESRGRRWGYLARPEHASRFLPFALQLSGWTPHVVIFTNGEFEIPEAARLRLRAAGTRIELEPLARLLANGNQLDAVELTNGTRVDCDLLFVHPPQRQIQLVSALGLELDAEGFVQVEPMRRETSTPGIYAAGDATTPMQAAIAAATSGLQAAASINVDLMMELTAAAAP
ncbi:MAG TPA: NAD(P)/FAD-dependent oxidoreductase [Polyangiaceae bacterium]|nr:NAD(P)/FAD-dependent oxidoreductase [Polyangiaceae bacterium]